MKYLSIRLTLVFTFSIALGWPFPAVSGEYRVSPIRLFLDQGTKTGVVSITNESEGPIQLQVRSFEWTQDAQGKDQYTETKDIIFFPRFMELKKDDRRVLRVGVKQSNEAREKTYRLFIEEISKPKEEKKGTGVDIAIRFGVPVFIAPVKEEHKGMIDGITLEKGKFSANVTNTGNSHFMIQAILVRGFDAKGIETFTHELSGWYLLAGAKRTYAIPISQETCKDTSSYQVEVQSKQTTFSENMDAITTLCLP